MEADDSERPRACSISLLSVAPTCLVVMIALSLAVTLSSEPVHRPRDQILEFVSIPKTASESIKQALVPYCASRKLTLRTHVHNKCLKLKRPVEGTIRFAVIRNPPDRFVSAFYYLRAGGSSPIDKSHQRLLQNFSNPFSLVTSDRIRWLQKQVIHLTPQTHFHRVGLTHTLCFGEQLSRDIRRLPLLRHIRIGRCNTLRHPAPSRRLRSAVCLLYAEDCSLWRRLCGNSSTVASTATRG